MFVDLNPDTEKIIYSHFTCATGNLHLSLTNPSFSSACSTCRLWKHQIGLLRSQGYHHASRPGRVWDGLMWELVDGTIEVFCGSGISQMVVFELPCIQNKDIDTGYTFGQVVWLEKVKFLANGIRKINVWTPSTLCINLSWWARCVGPLP